MYVFVYKDINILSFHVDRIDDVPILMSVWVDYNVLLRTINKLILVPCTDFQNY